MNLHLPQLNANEDDIARSPNTLRIIKRWETELPLVNMGETTRIFYMTLRLLNRQAIATKVRYDIMEQIRPTARIVLKHLKKHLSSLSYPLAGKIKQIAKLEHALLLELSVGYKHLIHEVVNHDRKFDNRNLVIAIHRAMRYLEEAMACNATIYSINIPGTWHDLHRLQGYAEASRLASIEVEDDSYQTIDHSTITDVYKQACLLSLSHPFRLRSGEAEKLRAYFETACHLCDLTKTLTPDANNGLVHVISLKSSEPPAFIPLANITTFSNLRGFDLSQLISTLSDMSQETQEEKYTSGFSKIHLDARLIKRLITSWTKQEKRRFNRISTHRRVVTAIGLKNIIHAINSDLNPEFTNDDFTDAKHQQSHEDPPYFDGFTAQLDASLSRENSNLIDPTYHGDIIHGSNTTYTLSSINEIPESWQEWEVINTGAGGYGLLWSNETPSLAQVGELIALREREYKIHHWRIGVIRWLRNSTQKGLEIGLQLIAPRSVVVSIETIQNRSYSEEMPYEALLLPGLKTIKQPPSLLAPNQVFTVGDILEVSILSKKLDIELKKIGENPSFYAQFFYRSSEVLQTVSPKEDFDNLWNRL
jgi:hypothetical protein